MTTREDPELEAVYKAGHQHSHAAGLREVYQAGRADEAAALRPQIQNLEQNSTEAAETLKRPIKNPGDPPPARRATDAEVPANTEPGAPPPGQNPPGEHPPSQA